MSGQWEVVGKKKSTKDNNVPISKKPENKKNPASTPRVEEVCKLKIKYPNLYQINVTRF